MNLTGHILVVVGNMQPRLIYAEEGLVLAVCKRLWELFVGNLLFYCRRMTIIVTRMYLDSVRALQYGIYSCLLLLPYYLMMPLGC